MSFDTKTKYGNSGCKNAVWNKGISIPGKNSDEYRYDAGLNVIKYSDYGKDSSTGWNVDHILAKNHGGDNYLGNLQPLQSAANKSYGDTLHKPVIGSYQGLQINEIHRMALNKKSRK